MESNINLEIYSEDKEILLPLLKNGNPIHVYSLHERFLLSPAQIARVIRKFTEIGVLEYNDNYISLSEKGSLWIIKHRRQIFSNKKNQNWKKPKEDQLVEGWIDDPSYIPIIRKIKKLIRRRV